MRIAFVADQLDCGGAEQQLVTLCRGLKERGHDVHVITLYDRIALRGELDAVGVSIAVAHKYGKFDLTAVWRVRTLLERIDPDLVHAFLPGASFVTPLTTWCGIKAPVLQSERGINDWRSPVRLRCDNIVRRRVAHITCNANAIKQHLIRVEGVASEKISVIYNGLQETRRTRPDDAAIARAAGRIGAPEGSVVVICVANFSAVKLHDVLLRAFADAKRRVPALFLLLVGRGELEDAIRRQLEELGLEHACRIVTDSTNPGALLCASHIAILTSRHEGCSNALLEAMAMGLPVVASDAGGNRELVVPEQGGYLCPVGAVPSFADALVALASRPEVSARMGRYNSARVAESFTDDALVWKSIELYSRILERRSRRPHGTSANDSASLSAKSL